MMLDAIISGVGVGLIISFLLGPVFFSLLYTSINRGFRAGAFFASGIVISDAALFFLAYLGFTQINDISSLKIFMGMIGGVILLLYGGRLWLKKNYRIKFQQQPTQASLFGCVAKGFLINGMNPFVFMYWLGIVGGLGIKYDFNSTYIFGFFSACMATIFTLDLLKSHLSCKLQKWLRLRVFFWINRVSAVLLIFFGLWLLYRVFSEYPFSTLFVF